MLTKQFEWTKKNNQHSMYEGHWWNNEYKYIV